MSWTVQMEEKDILYFQRVLIVLYSFVLFSFLQLHYNKTNLKIAEALFLAFYSFSFFLA